MIKNKPKILIVDDQKANLLALNALLTELDANVLQASSGNEALFESLNHDFALVLLDVQMPVMDGFEVAEIMRSNNKTKHVPIIFLTAISKEKKNVFKGYESGAVDYLFKPLEPDILLSKVRVFLELYQQKMELFQQKETLQEMVLKIEANNQQLLNEISERIGVERQLRILSQAIEQSPVSVIITDTDNKIEFVNSKFEQVTGYTQAEAQGRALCFLKSASTPGFVVDKIRQSVHEGNIWRGELCSVKKNGKQFWEYLSISPIRSKDGKITNYLSVQEDITQRKEYEEALLHKTNYDDVTNLPNRILALDRLIQESARVLRTDIKIAVLYIDLDDFKKINDSLGHHAGDQILVEAAERLKSFTRKGDTLARLGGDEFIIVLIDVDTEASVEKFAQKVLKTFSTPFSIEGKMIVVTTSIGITFAPDDAVEPRILMQNAEQAMYQVKERGGNDFSFFTLEINKRLKQRLTLETQLRNALANNELQVHYQPIQDVKTGKLIGAEALARWYNPELGHVSPEQFIPIAESTDIIHELGSWVMSQAATEALKWQQEFGLSLRVAVNVSSRQFAKYNLADSVLQLLQQTGILPEMLELEITEGLLMQTDESIISVLSELRGMGVRLSIDDFGTGYSSLSYLKRFPINTLKIDRAFIQNLTIDREDSVLVKAIIAMAHGLGMEVIAEGVEEVEQLEFIKRYDCNLVQGYYFSKALPADEFSAYISHVIKSSGEV